MAYTLEQIYEALGGVENGGDMADDLQKLIKKTRDESAKYRTEKNSAMEQLEESQTERKNILSQLGLRDGDDINAALKSLTESAEALRLAGNDPRQLGAQVKSMQKQLKELNGKYEESEKRAKEEHDRSVRANVRSKVMSALTQGKAIKPDAMFKILEGNITIDDNDNAFFKNGDDEVSLDDGVSQWLKDNPWAVKADVQSGAGGGSKNPASKRYSMEDLKKMSPAEINAHWDEISKGVDN